MAGYAPEPREGHTILTWQGIAPGGRRQQGLGSVDPRSSRAFCPHFPIPAQALARHARHEPNRSGRGGRRVGFLTTTTVFNAPQDVGLEELRIESYFPLDTATARACEQLAAQR